MKNSKLKLISIAVLLIVVSCLALFTSCGGPEVSDIAVKSTSAPRLTYVLGQDLDLSEGALTVIVDGNETSVPYDAEGVSITGYDKNKLGKQTLTVTYMDKTTTFEVNVVARMVAENFETSYFIDDVFDNSKGRLKLTEDNGNTVTINMNNPSVTLKSFDSSVAGVREVTVSYTDIKSNTYECSFNVNVYGIGEVSIKKPSKTAYSSHDTELSLNGAYLTVKADGLDTLSKYVPLDSPMVTVSGFDPAAATIENRDEPLEQTVTFTYAGHSFDFDITVIYSSISIIQDAAKALKDITFSPTEEIIVTEDQGKLAVDAITEYLKLTQAKKNLIDKKDIEAVVRPAAHYLNTLFYEEAKQFSDVFVLDNKANFVLIGTSYAVTKIVAERLADPEENFNVYADLLLQIEEEFADTKIVGAIKIPDYVVVTTKEAIDFYIGVLNCLTRVHESLQNIPTTWKAEDLSKYANEITTAVYLISASGCTTPANIHVFNILKNWRPENDYFDIIYSYYYNVAKDGKTYIAKTLWMKFPLPDILQAWYNAWYNAAYQAQFMQQNATGTGTAYLYDTTTFMYYYTLMYKLANDIKTGDNELYKNIYELFNGDLVMTVNTKYSPVGYATLMGGSLDSENCADLWAKYLKLFELYNTGKLSLDGTNAADFDAVLDALTALTPSELFSFITSLKYSYEQSNGQYYAFDFSKNASCQLVYYLANYYVPKLPEAAKGTFQQLLLAMESYALYCIFPDASSALTTFEGAISSVNSTYEKLSQADKDSFGAILGDLYTKYLSIYNAMKATDAPSLGDNQAMLDEFKATVDAFYQVMAYIGDSTKTETERSNALIVLFSLYEKAASIYDTMLKTDNADLINTLFIGKYTQEDTVMTYDTAMHTMRNMFAYYMLSLSFQVNSTAGGVSMPIWEYYSASKLDEFLTEASYVLSAYFLKGSLDSVHLYNTMENLRNLSANDRQLLYRIGLNTYYDAMQSFLYSAIVANITTENEADKDNLMKLVTAVLRAEISFTSYDLNKDKPDYVKAFTDAFAEAVALYGQIGDTELRDDIIGEAYEYYLAFYNQIASNTEATN